MSLIKSIFLVTVLTATMTLSTVGGEAAGSNPEGAAAFVRNLSDEATRSLTKPDIPRAERVQRFRVLFRKHFAVRTIGKATLKRHWGLASDAEKKEFFTLFEDLMVVSYVDHFTKYSGGTLKILKAVPGNREGRAVVHSNIAIADKANPVSVQWLVGGQDQNYKVLDVFVAGLSMTGTLSDDFVATIRANGGKIAGLLEKLREKTAALKAGG